VNNEMKWVGRGKGRCLSSWRYKPGIFLEKMEKAMRNLCEARLSPERNPKPSAPKYIATAFDSE
jgi:hypothetical protein